MTYTDEKLAGIVGAALVERDQQAGPYLELRRYAGRSHQAGKGRRATTVHVAAGVEVKTGPANMPVMVDTPARLRRMAYALERAADWLEVEARKPVDPGDTPTLLDALAELTP